MSPESWFPIAISSHFSLANIPFGIISTAVNKASRPAIAIGEHALDLEVFSAEDGFSSLPSVQKHLVVFSQPTLNAFATLGRPLHREVRRYIQDVLRIDTPFPDILKDNKALQAKCLVRLKDVKMHLPMQIGDYTDFFAGKNHAYNVGVMFRGSTNALQPNYTHLPVGYHGRASSVVCSGTPIRRPHGQMLENPTAVPKVPSFGPCKKLDIELELGAFVCRDNKMGERIPISEAADSLFGLVLMNDWSARDIQMWEYVPLGPFNAKNFGTSISPWVVLMDALEPFRTEGIDNETQLLPYLREEKNNFFDIKLEVDIARE
jgi:fumarylacetoacetase